MIIKYINICTYNIYNMFILLRLYFPNWSLFQQAYAAKNYKKQIRLTNVLYAAGKTVRTGRR